MSFVKVMLGYKYEAAKKVFISVTKLQLNYLVNKWDELIKGWKTRGSLRWEHVTLRMRCG